MKHFLQKLFATRSNKNGKAVDNFAGSADFERGVSDELRSRGAGLGARAAFQIAVQTGASY
ncbi:MAG TPA: hypothetical protein VK156_03045, partial [Candidatus Limnocylindria bacterium]|nr:hypothetical protein [Candidatus Limnocylindria bacterium]